MSAAARCATALASFLALLTFALPGTIARAQSLPGGITFGTPAPPGSESRNGLYAIAPVVLDGVTLFNVATAIEAKDQLPVTIRASLIDGVLAQIINADDPAYSPASLRVEIARHGQQYVLEVKDDEHRDGLPVLTITSADAGFHQESAAALATDWQETLQGALVHSLVIRQPDVQHRSALRAAIVFIALIAATLGVSALLGLLRRHIDEAAQEVERRGQALAAEASEPSSADAANPEERRARIVDLLVRSIGPARRLSLLRALRDACIWALGLAWISGIGWAALLFPRTTPLGHRIITSSIAIAVVWVVASIVDRIMTVAINALPAIWDVDRIERPDERARQTLRLPSIVRAANGLKTFVIVFIAALATLTSLGVPVGSVVTIGGVAAIAVSLAAQNLVRDFVSGYLVLAEDQYVAGDYVTINAMSGIVERLTLRMVQVRDGSGSLITIAHSSATSVINHSRNWSRVDYAVRSTRPSTPPRRWTWSARSSNNWRPTRAGPRPSSSPSNGSESMRSAATVLSCGRASKRPRCASCAQARTESGIARGSAKRTSPSARRLRLDASDRDDLDAGLEVLANGRPPLDGAGHVLAGNHSAEHRIAVVVGLALAIEPRVVPEVDIELRRSGVGRGVACHGDRTGRIVQTGRGRELERNRRRRIVLRIDAALDDLDARRVLRILGVDGAIERRVWL